jgi:hypothetical protein
LVKNELPTRYITNAFCDYRLTACSFRWFVVAESTVCWFVMREKHRWMAADSDE